MASVDWHDAGRLIGHDLAQTGGAAANIDVGTIGFAAAKEWLDGALDGLQERGFDAKSISVSSSLIDSMRATAGWQEGDTYRGVAMLVDGEPGGQSSIVVAV